MCFAMMTRKKYHPPRLNKLLPGSPEYDEAREAVLSDALAQIKIRKFREISDGSER